MSKWNENFLQASLVLFSRSKLFNFQYRLILSNETEINEIRSIHLLPIEILFFSIFYRPNPKFLTNLKSKYENKFCNFKTSNIYRNTCFYNVNIYTIFQQIPHRLWKLKNNQTQNCTLYSIFIYSVWQSRYRIHRNRIEDWDIERCVYFL